jgi:deoxyadenosine/deoxycytidine kinase
MLVTIEGNIGSGKSTIINYLRNLKSDDIVFVDEPVSEWLSIKHEGKNALEVFYENQKENSFWFQILAYITRLRNLLHTLEEHPEKIIICERSIYTDKYVFAKMLYESGNINEMEWKTYSYWFDTFKNKTQLDLILYVNTEPDECYNRILKRSRPEEINKISKDYLTMCHNKHLQWFQDTSNTNKIIHINGHNSVEEVMEYVKTITAKLIDEKQNQKQNQK